MILENIVRSVKNISSISTADVKNYFRTAGIATAATLVLLTTNPYITDAQTKPVKPKHNITRAKDVKYSKPHLVDKQSQSIYEHSLDDINKSQNFSIGNERFNMFNNQDYVRQLFASSDPKHDTVFVTQNANNPIEGIYLATNTKTGAGRVVVVSTNVPESYTKNAQSNPKASKTTAKKSSSNQTVKKTDEKSAIKPITVSESGQGLYANPIIFIEPDKTYDFKTKLPKGGKLKMLDFVVVTPETAYQWADEGSKKFKGKDTLDPIYRSDKKLMQWFDSTRNVALSSGDSSAYPSINYSDTTLGMSILNHINSGDVYTPKETHEDAVMVGKSGRNKLWAGIVRTLEYVLPAKNKKDKPQRVNATYPFMIQLYSVTPDTTQQIAGVIDSSKTNIVNSAVDTSKNTADTTKKAAQNSLQKNTPKAKEDSLHSVARQDSLHRITASQDSLQAQVADSSRGYFAGVNVLYDKNQKDNNIVPGLVVGRSFSPYFDLEANVSMVIPSTNNYDSTWASTFGSTKQKFTDKISGWKAGLRAWAGSKSFKFGLGARYNENKENIESTTDEILYDRLGNISREKLGFSQPTLTNKEHYWSITPAVKLRMFGNTYFNVEADVPVTGDYSKTSVGAGITFKL